jgi:hypothetical protein
MSDCSDKRPRLLRIERPFLCIAVGAGWSLLLDLNSVHNGPNAAHTGLRTGRDTHPRSRALQHKIELALIIGLFGPSQAFEGKQAHFIRSGHETCS